MSAPAWLIRELEQAIQNGSPQFVTTLVTRIGGPFLARTDFNTERVRLFDQVLSRLLMDAVVEVRLELARRLAPLDSSGNSRGAMAKQWCRNSGVGTYVSSLILRNTR
jgi:hypothetical protein